jgi:DNA-binding NarL/FixJ family response regulator
VSPIRVLKADDHPLFRDGVHGLLDSVEETEVASEAADGTRLSGRRLSQSLTYFLSGE